MKNKILNSMSLQIPAKSENESFARSVVAAFSSSINPTIDEINDLKTAISEAVTNCVVHAYAKKQSASDMINIDCLLYENMLDVKISDNGVGIKDINKAMEPFFTTIIDGERSGMGFTVMQSFMDEISVNNNNGGGTVINMKKYFTKEEKKVSGE